MTTAIKHAFTSGKADGADATLVRPSNWNAGHNPYLSMTNRSGSAVAQFDACAVGTANDDSFTKTTTVGDTRPLVVVEDTAGIADATAGNVQNNFATTVNVQGAVVRNNYLRFSATAGKLEDTGTASTSTAPNGACAVAVSGAAGPGAGTVTAILGVKTAPTVLATPTMGTATSAAGNFTDASGGFVDITSASITITTLNRRVLLSFTCTNSNSADGNINSFAFLVDGTMQNGTAGWRDTAVATRDMVTTITFLTAALTAASHTFKVQTKASAGTVTVLANATNSWAFSAIEQLA